MARDPDRIFSCDISERDADTRLDVFFRQKETGLSRSRIQSLIRNGRAEVNGSPSKPGYRLKPGDRVCLTIPPAEKLTLTPEAVPFEVIYEDVSLIVLSKPAGVVVHPAPGHATQTLVHGLLEHCRDLSGIGGVLRPGIVHRLDKDTSGLLVVAKNDMAHASLAAQFKKGSVRKEYLALVHGHMIAESGEIDFPIARHPVKRKEMAVAGSGGRHALTLWHRAKEFRAGFSLLSVTLKTGRTHQIRVHLSHLGHPVAGDPVYGRHRDRWKRQFPWQPDQLPEFGRQMLHAALLGFVHPVTGSHVVFKSAPPNDMASALNRLEALDQRIERLGN